MARPAFELANQCHCHSGACTFYSNSSWLIYILLITGVHSEGNWNHLFHRYILSMTVVSDVKIGYNQYNRYAAVVRCNVGYHMVVFSVVNPRGYWRQPTATGQIC
jgi:hypothetical protein